MLMEVSYDSLFIYYGSHLTKPVPLTTCAWVRAAALRPVSFRPVNLNETKGANMLNEEVIVRPIRERLHQKQKHQTQQRIWQSLGLFCLIFTSVLP